MRGEKERERNACVCVSVIKGKKENEREKSSQGVPSTLVCPDFSRSYSLLPSHKYVRLVGRLLGPCGAVWCVWCLVRRFFLRIIDQIRGENPEPPTYRGPKKKKNVLKNKIKHHLIYFIF